MFATLIALKVVLGATTPAQQDTVWMPTAVTNPDEYEVLFRYKTSDWICALRRRSDQANVVLHWEETEGYLRSVFSYGVPRSQWILGKMRDRYPIGDQFLAEPAAKPASGRFKLKVSTPDDYIVIDVFARPEDAPREGKRYRQSIDQSFESEMPFWEDCLREMHGKAVGSRLSANGSVKLNGTPVSTWKRTQSSEVYVSVADLAAVLGYQAKSSNSNVVVHAERPGGERITFAAGARAIGIDGEWIALPSITALKDGQLLISDAAIPVLR